MGLMDELLGVVELEGMNLIGECGGGGGSVMHATHEKYLATKYPIVFPLFFFFFFFFPQHFYRMIQTFI